MRQLKSKKQRVVGHWNSLSDRPETHPSITARQNRLASGSQTIDRYQYVAKKYLSKGGLIALSPGCGTGEHEIEWAKQGVFARIDAVDISPVRIAQATKNATDQGVGHICNFKVADLETLSAKDQQYDTVIYESSLHHFSPMRKILEKTSNLLRDDGLVLMYEYVGPTKWQWIPEQLDRTNAMLQLLPERYRRLANGQILTKRVRPSLLRMYLMDPSEAIESDLILPTMRELFTELEWKNTGGALLNHFIGKVQQNFDPDSEIDQSWLNCLMSIDDISITESSEVGLWYAFGVYQKKPELDSTPNPVT